VILSNRELRDDALLNRGDCTIIERADAPTAKQIAVIWVNEEGEAPDIKGKILLVVFFIRVIYLIYRFCSSRQSGKAARNAYAQSQYRSCLLPFAPYSRYPRMAHWFEETKLAFTIRTRPNGNGKTTEHRG
jgi:hypothetical protein